jgi:hypothetical protein
MSYVLWMKVLSLNFAKESESGFRVGLDQNEEVHRSVKNLSPKQGYLSNGWDCKQDGK